MDGSELDWLTTTVSYISFTRGWADGWRALLKKLDSISTPRLLANAAPLAASSFPRGEDLVNDTGEQLLTNIIRVKSFPNILRVFRVARSIDSEDWKKLGENQPVTIRFSNEWRISGQQSRRQKPQAEFQILHLAGHRADLLRGAAGEV